MNSPIQESAIITTSETIHSPWWALVLTYTVLILGMAALWCSTLDAQEKPAVHASAAEDSLRDLAKNYATDRAELTVKMQQAQQALVTKNKGPQDEINKRIQPLVKKANEITADLQKQIDANKADAEKQFQQNVAPLQNKVMTAQVQAQALASVVKKEQGLPDGATFDLEKGTWNIPKAKADAKK